jgi:hypothetical protein
MDKVLNSGRVWKCKALYPTPHGSLSLDTLQTQLLLATKFATGYRTEEVARTRQQAVRIVSTTPLSMEVAGAMTEGLSI